MKVHLNVSSVYDYSQGLPNQRNRIKYGKAKQTIVKNSLLNYAHYSFINFEKVRLNDGSYTIDTSEKLKKHDFISHTLVGNEITDKSKRRISHTKSKGNVSIDTYIDYDTIPQGIERIVNIMLMVHRKAPTDNGKYRGKFIIRLNGVESAFNHKIEVKHKANGKLQINSSLYRFLSMLLNQSYKVAI